MREEEETDREVASVGDKDLTGVGIPVRLGIYFLATLEGGSVGRRGRRTPRRREKAVGQG